MSDNDFFKTVQENSKLKKPGSDIPNMGFADVGKFGFDNDPEETAKIEEALGSTSRETPIPMKEIPEDDSAKTKVEYKVEVFKLESESHRRRYVDLQNRFWNEKESFAWAALNKNWDKMGFLTIVAEYAEVIKIKPKEDKENKEDKEDKGNKSERKTVFPNKKAHKVTKSKIKPKREVSAMPNSYDPDGVSGESEEIDTPMSIPSELETEILGD